MKFDRKCKNVKRKFYQQIYYKHRNKRDGGGGGYSVLVNYPSLLSNIFPLAPSIIFLYKRLTKCVTPSEFY